MKDNNVRYGNRGKMLSEHLDKCCKGKKICRHSFKHISKWFRYVFSDMADWKWLDNQHKSSGSKQRNKYRKVLARIAKRKDNREVKKDIDSEMNTED